MNTTQKQLSRVAPLVAIALFVIALVTGLSMAQATESQVRTLAATLGDGTVVTVEASTDAVPEGTTLEASAVDNEAVTQAVMNAAEQSGTELSRVKAIDITLRDAQGNEVEPSAAVNVTISQTGLESDNVSVYHVTSATGNEASATTPDSLSVSPVDTYKATAEEQVFSANSFSIYAVGEGLNRLAVTFHQIDGSTKVIYVTKKDLDANRISDIVYDPGAGTLKGSQNFKGWTTNADWTADTQGMDIEGVRGEVSSKLGGSFSDGDTLDFYPVVVSTCKVTYLNQSGTAVQTDEVRVKAGNTATYTVNCAYTPDAAESRFEGWSETDHSTTVQYANGDAITFGESSNDLTLYPVVIDGV